MKEIKIIAMILLICGSSFSCVKSTANTNQNPEMVVRYYYELAKNEDFEKIKELIIVRPEEYWEWRKKELGLTDNENQNDIEEDKGGFSANPDNSYTSAFKLKFLNSDIPKLIYRNKEVVREVHTIRVDGRITKVMVLTDSEISRKYKGKQEFYLYLINDEWKICMIQ